MKRSKLVGTALAFGSSVYFTSTVFANDAIGWIDTLKTSSGGVTTDLDKWIPQVLNLVIGLAALVCVAILIASGYMYITAAGDENKVEKANKSLTYAIVGLVICFISVILVEFVLNRVLIAG